jgi:hypothetical protein
MTVTEPCVSLTTGTLSPSQRVNYAFGMVLGLDEFLQEQLHRLGHESGHERFEHGYGTSSGLAASVAPVAGATDFRVTITTGAGVDQWGRRFVVTCDQCADLGAWLAAQEAQTPGVVADHLGPSGELTAYVVASYGECLDDLVPLPGQPCSTSPQSMAPSRVRDAWNVELRWARPAMPRWDTDRRLARLLDGVDIVGGLPESDSDELAITEAVLALAAVADDGPSDLDVDGTPSGTAWRLPADTAAEALDRIFTVWVTRVRPELYPELREPEPASDPAILLTTLTFVPASPFDPAAPAVVACAEPDDEGRPFLLHTQLIQELRWLNNALLIERVHPVQLATLAADGTDLTVWFHHLPGLVLLPDTLDVVDDFGREVTYFVQDAGTFADAWVLNADNDQHHREGAQLTVRFPGTEVLVGNAATTLADVQTGGLTFLDSEPNGDVVAYTAVRLPPVVVVPTQDQRASQPFVTITAQAFRPLVVANPRIDVAMELWFHPRHRGPLDDAFIVRPVLQVFDEKTGNELKTRIGGPAPFSRNVWGAVSSSVEDSEEPQYLRLIFWTKQCGIETAAGEALTLADWIEKEEILFEGWTQDDAAILAFARAAALPKDQDVSNPDLPDFDRRLNAMIGDPRTAVTPAVLRNRIAADREFFMRNR